MSKQTETTNICARFGKWQLNFADETLSELVDDKEVAVELDNICRKALAYLIKNYDRVVTSEELLQNVWRVNGVTNERVSRAMSVIRTTLGDSATHSKIIKTISRSGYQFIADFETIEVDANKKFAHELNFRVKVFSISIFVLLMIYLAGVGGYYYISNSLKELKVKSLNETIDFAHNFSLSRDSEAMAFISAKDDSITESGGDLIIKKFNSKENIPIVSGRGHSRLYNPTFNPQRASIAYKRIVEGVSCEIIVVDLNPEMTEVIGEEITVPCSSKKIFVGFMDWSSDGENLLYSDFSKTSSNMAVFRVNIKTKVVDQITSPPSSSVGDYYGRASRKTDEFIFLRDVSQTVAQLWSINLQNLEQKLVYTFEEHEYPRFVDFSSEDEYYVYQNNAGVFYKLDFKTKGTKDPVYILYKPTEAVDSMKMCTKGNLFASQLIPEQPLIVKINNPFVSATAKHRSLKVSEYYSLNPSRDRPDGYLTTAQGETELWLDFKNGRKKMVHTFNKKHFNSKIKFSHDGKRLIVVIGGDVFVYDIDANSMKLINKEGQMLIRPTWGKNSSVIYVIDSKNWELNAVDVLSGEQTKYLDGVSAFKQSPDGRYEILVRYGSNIILLTDKHEGSVMELDMPDFLNAKDLMVAFNNGYAYLKCAKCKMPGNDSAQTVMRVDLINKTTEVKALDILGESREFFINEDGTEFIIDSKANKKTYQLQVLY